MPACVIAGVVIVGDLDALADGASIGSIAFARPKVEDLDRAVGPYLDIRGLQIAVNDPLLVSGLQRLRNLLRDRQGFIEWNRAASYALREVIAFDEFHHERGSALTLFESVDGCDIGMIQRGEDFGFALKTCEPIVVSGERWRQNLDRDLTLQLGVGGSIYLPHPAFADLGRNLEDAEARAGSERQVADYMGVSASGRGSLTSARRSTDRCRMTSGAM
jgi:hypothetical protein